MTKLSYSETNVDLLVIGGGLTAFRALYNVDRQNNKIILVSDGLGASPFVHGISIPLTKEDSVEKLYEDILVSSYFQCDKKLAHTLASNSLKVFDFIKEIGFDFNHNENGEYEVLKPLGMNYPRVVSIGNALGLYVLNHLKDEIKKDIDLVKGRVIKIFKNDSSFSSICVTNDKIMIINSKCILAASGGFSRLFSFNTNTKDISGDTIAGLFEIGADVVDMEFVQFEPSVAVYPKKLVGRSVITTMMYEGAILTNKHNERFMLKYDSNGERVNKDIMSKAIANEILIGNGNENEGIYFDATGVPKEILLTKYKSYYERYINVGIDISKTPMQIAPGAHTTLGGLKIDTKCNTTVKGIFAAGEIVGGIHGANRLGGCAGLETLVFGDIAGTSINEYLKKVKTLPISRSDKALEFVNSLTKSSVKLDKERNELANILTNSFSVIRNKDNMEKGYKELLNLLSKLKANDISSIRLRNDINVALLLAKSAIERNMSVGCHYISGLDSKKETKRYQIIINKKEGLRRLDL